MVSSSSKLMVCIHGHFYQPPRENPWLDDLEREPSAAPHHNWNSRIAEECYTPNAWARVLDDRGRVVRLYDNYTRLSFNVGPTLTGWLGRHVPETLDAMVAADRESVARLGNGNAMAQVYNHAIMPLCNRRDKYTQVRWGMRAFERTFGRKARGIWLAETAVDADTMEVLAEEGVDFTVLSPFQAHRFRVDAGADTTWQPCQHGSIPTGRAYRYTTKSGKVVAIFFYDGALARGIAFERLLGDAGHLVDALVRAHDAAPANEPWLVHTATDGESYGHHFRFGDMALAAAFSRLDARDDVEVVNYATFLDRVGCRGDVELLPVSAWSCAHGVGRWERDCGCRMNPDPTWSQRWRTGLRAALNGLRDGLAPFYEHDAAALLKDPWAARDASIDVVLDGGLAPDAGAAFFARHAVTTLEPADRERALRLLEMQRCAMLMFTSCGWFFDDVSGPESVILLRYAARALSLARELDAEEAGRLEHRFMADLVRAESNVRRADGTVRTARDVYLEDAVTAVIGADRIAVSLALTCATGAPTPTRLAAWKIVEHDEVALDDRSVPCVVGRVGLADQRLESLEHLAFAVVDFGGIDQRGVLVPPARIDALRDALQDAADASALARVLDDAVAAGARPFSLRDAPADLRDVIAMRALARRVDVTDAVLAELLLSERSLLRGVVAVGGTLPAPVKGLLAHAMSRRARDIVAELVAAEGLTAPHTRRLKTVLADATGFGVALDLDETVRSLEGAAAGVIVRLAGGHDEPGALERAVRLVAVLQLLVGERPLLRLLKATSALSESARTNARVAVVARSLLPALNAACRSAFPTS